MSPTEIVVAGEFVQLGSVGVAGIDEPAHPTTGTSNSSILTGTPEVR